ncbi:MAG: IS66 family insertion sequence element accessory protein TnpB [Chlamydiia bacterium]|nr:IS66 family insertion sequence element accessory protein TnpB [Chlamydiia bacterium]
MLTISSAVKILLHQNSVDMRKSFEGLSAIIQQAFPEQLLTGSLFIFLNKARDKMKVLYWDTDGLAIWYKMLEKGTFSRGHINREQLSRTEFLMLLEGVTPQRIQKRWNPT